jgi:hypothetical protein
LNQFDNRIDKERKNHKRVALQSWGGRQDMGMTTLERPLNGKGKQAKKLPSINDTAAVLGAPDDAQKITITRPNFQIASIPIRGTTPLVIHRFSQKVQNTIKETQEAGSQANKGKTRKPRDFSDNYENARYRAKNGGWDGIPAAAFRNALISACRTVGFKMTIAKMSVFCIPDGFCEDGTGLVRIVKGEPHCDIRPGRNANGGVDLRSRPMWEEGWEATVTLRWDADQFSSADLINLLARAGMQVGVCEGRPDSKMSAGCGWGEFEIIE